MITPEQKDQILIELIQANKEFITVGSDTFSIPFFEVESILRQFVDRKFIFTRIQSTRRYGVRVEVGAHDFIQRGGFKFEEDIFKNSFTKLELELAKLEKENPTISFDNATKLIGAVASGFDIYKNLSS